MTTSLTAEEPRFADQGVGWTGMAAAGTKACVNQRSALGNRRSANCGQWEGPKAAKTPRSTVKLSSLGHPRLRGFLRWGPGPRGRDWRRRLRREAPGWLRRGGGLSRAG